MPRIKAFTAIHPAPSVAGQVPLQVEDLSLDRAKTIRQENPLSYINMLVPKLDNPYQRGSKLELSYKKINENFEEFIENSILIQDKVPAVYVYQINHNNLIQNGIWTVTSIDNYLDNTVRKHEHTREEREKSLVDYIRQTGIDANPVLITYPSDPVVNSLMQEAMKAVPMLDFMSEGECHKLWKIEDTANVDKIIDRFAQLNPTYIADGHHRAAAACTYGIQSRKLNLKHTGEEEYNFFSSVYMAFDQLSIYEFHRLIKHVELEEDQFIESISSRFHIKQSPGNLPVKPLMPRTFGMYTMGKWYSLELKSELFNPSDPVDSLDVSILQNNLLNPVLGIEDPRSDKRLNFVGGTMPAEHLGNLVDKGEFSIAFTLFPTSIGELVRVADSGEVMPPKSTWFEPKFRAGLLIHKVN